MEDILKKLQGKQLTKNSIFNFLLENISSISLPNTSVNEVIIPSVIIPAVIIPSVIIQATILPSQIEFRCDACMKICNTEVSLKQHQDKSIACKTWSNLPQKDLIITLSKGIHLVIDDILNDAISDNGALECKFCKCKFSNKGNHHKHYNSSTLCNNLAYDEFKRLILHN